MHHANLLILPGGKRWILLFGHLQLRRLIFSRGLLMKPLVAFKFEQHCRSREHPGLQSHWLGGSSRVHFSFSDSVLRLRMQGDTAVEHKHERLKWTPLSQGLLFISCPFLWLWSSDLWKGWSTLPRKVLWGNGSRDKITLPAWSRRVRIPPSWYLWTKILEEWGIWHIKDSHLLWISCRLMIFHLFCISSKIHRSSHFLPYLRGIGTSLVVQQLRFHTPKAGGPSLISDQGTRSHMPQLRVHMLQLKILNKYLIFFFFFKGGELGRILFGK